MATTITGTVDSLKRLFENTGNASGSYINKRDGVFNETSRSLNASKVNSSLNGSLQLPSSSSGISLSNFSNSGKQILANNNSLELARTKSVPPKVKPKPVIYRNIVSSLKDDTTKQPEKIEFIQRISNSAMELRPIANISTVNGSESKDFDSSKHVAEISNALPPVSFNSHPPTSKKPPPVAKKPRSILSGYSNRSSHAQSKYDEALEEQFGMKVDVSSYDYVERWANHQVKAQLEMAHRKPKGNGDESDSKLTTSGISRQKSETPSISSGTILSGSNFTNSSIRSILKKGLPSLGLEKKRLTFKADSELITKYDYPSEDNYNEGDSLDHFRSALGSDSDSSSSTFDDSPDYEPDIVGSVSTSRSSGRRGNENGINATRSNSSSVSSSTLKGSISHQPKRSSSSNRVEKNCSKNHSKINGFAESRTNSPSKRSDTFTAAPLILTPTKTDTFKRFSNSGIRFHY